jgi:hypothetical protein
LTEDLDLAGPDRVKVSGSGLRDALESQGFVVEMSSDDRPPIERYHLTTLGGFELEFIAPLRGGPVGRGGKPKVTTNVLGVSAQMLRHVEVLLLEPVAISMPELGVGVSFGVVNPAAFLIQRLLILPLRPRLSKKGKDALYVHDVLELFTQGGHVQPAVVEEALRVWQTLSDKQRKRLAETAKALGAASNDAVREASRIAKESLRPNALTPEALALACRLGLNELLSGG